MQRPKMQFADNEELGRYLREWQERLFLNDWIIDAKLVDELYSEEKNIVLGRNDFCLISRVSNISISRYNPVRDNSPRSLKKYCAEQILVHELLHLVYNFMTLDYSNYIAATFDTLEHQQLDKLADSFIMAKYNLSYDYFINKKD